MDFVIIHGSGLAASSSKLSSLRKDFDRLAVSSLNAKQEGWGRVLEEINTPQLFTQKRMVVIEEADDDSDLSAIAEDDNLSLVFKFTKALSPKSQFLKSAQKFKPKIFLFEERDETNIFPFLDLLGQKSNGAFLQLEKYLSEWGGQYVLTMIFYMFRRLVLPVKHLPPFVAKKIEAQKKNFTIEQITEFYKEALEMDFKIKNGLLEERLGLTLLVEKILKV